MSRWWSNSNNLCLVYSVTSASYLLTTHRCHRATTFAAAPLKASDLPITNSFEVGSTIAADWVTSGEQAGSDVGTASAAASMQLTDRSMTLSTCRRAFPCICSQTFTMNGAPRVRRLSGTSFTSMQIRTPSPPAAQQQPLYHPWQRRPALHAPVAAVAEVCRRSSATRTTRVSCVRPGWYE